jgi:hypothetical protein
MKLVLSLLLLFWCAGQVQAGSIDHSIIIDRIIDSSKKQHKTSPQKIGAQKLTKCAILQQVEPMPDTYNPLHFLNSFPPQSRLNVPLDSQQMEFWCWAACSQMVLNFEKIDIDQCDIVKAAFGLSATDCHDCDEARYIPYLQQHTGQYLRDSLNLSQLKNELAQQHPVFVVWSRGTTNKPEASHMVVITGYSPGLHGDIVVDYNDPDSLIGYQTVSLSYLRFVPFKHVWDRTYTITQ